MKLSALMLGLLPAPAFAVAGRLPVGKTPDVADQFAIALLALVILGCLVGLFLAFRR